MTERTPEEIAAGLTEAQRQVIRNLSTTPAVLHVLGSNHTSGCACPLCAAAQWQAGQEGEG